MILSPLIPVDPGVYLLIQPVGGDGCSIDTDINGKSILLALQAHNQKTDDYKLIYSDGAEAFIDEIKEK